MTEKKDTRVVVLSDLAKKQLDANPEMHEAVTEFVSKMTTAMTAFKNGEYATMDDAIEAILGSRPKKLTEEEAARVTKEWEEFDDD